MGYIFNSINKQIIHTPAKLQITPTITAAISPAMHKTQSHHYLASTMMYGTLNSPDNPLDAGIGSMITIVVRFVEPMHPVPPCTCYNIMYKGNGVL